MYASKEQFEMKHPFVTVIFSEHSPAEIEGNFTRKRNAEIAQNKGKVYGTILNRKDAEMQIKIWNAKHKFGKPC